MELSLMLALLLVFIVCGVIKRSWIEDIFKVLSRLIKGEGSYFLSVAFSTCKLKKELRLLMK